MPGVFASVGLVPLRDGVAGIEVEMPQAMGAFDRYDHPSLITRPGVTAACRFC